MHAEHHGRLSVAVLIHLEAARASRQATSSDAQCRWRRLLGYLALCEGGRLPNCKVTACCCRHLLAACTTWQSKQPVSATPESSWKKNICNFACPALQHHHFGTDAFCEQPTFGRAVAILKRLCGHNGCHHRQPKPRNMAQGARLHGRRHCGLPCSRCCVAACETEAALLLLLRWCRRGCRAAKPKSIWSAGCGRPKACRDCCRYAAKRGCTCPPWCKWHGCVSSTGGGGAKCRCWLCCLPKDGSRGSGPLPKCHRWGCWLLDLSE